MLGVRGRNPLEKGRPVARLTLEAPEVTEAPKADTKTPTPIHSMMKWVASKVCSGDGCGCPSKAENEKAWRAWFTDKDVALAGLRDAMVADGWNADTTIGFFKKMAASKAASSDCGSSGDCCGKCDGGDCSDCPCDKAKAAKKAEAKPAPKADG